MILGFITILLYKFMYGTRTDFCYNILYAVGIPLANTTVEGSIPIQWNDYSQFITISRSGRRCVPPHNIQIDSRFCLPIRCAGKSVEL